MSSPPGHRDAAAWAPPVETLTVADGHINLTGRRRTAPIHGFGRMWQKTYLISLGSEVTPDAGIAPGEVVALDLGMPWHVKHNSGIRSFTHMLGTPFRAMRPNRPEA